jgi:hypothetical protein
MMNVHVGGWQTAPDGAYAWGYCFVKEQNPGSYCSPSSTYPCAGGKQYYGRGTVQLSWQVQIFYYCYLVGIFFFISGFTYSSTHFQALKIKLKEFKRVCVI